MDSSTALLDEGPDPPPRILERLRQLAGYAWNEDQRPYHSSYDNWHVFGTRFVSPYSSSLGSPPQPFASPPAPGKLSTHSSGRSTGEIPTVSGLHSEGLGDRSAASPPIFSTAASDLNNIEEQKIVARISYYTLREERTFHIAKNLSTTADPEGRHIVKPIDLIRLTPLPGDRAAIIVSIYENPGPNYLFQKVDLGPAFFFAEKFEDRLDVTPSAQTELQNPITISDFLEFAIGSTQCLEILHHAGMVHGEIRADAFHFNIDTSCVKLVSFGSGVRSFEQGLTSNGWSTLSKELGAKNKLIYISPEQTGRMPAEPDTRTDIYSLGVVFWTLLTQQPVFTGATPLDIVQCVLSRRIPLVSSIRTDVHEVLARIIQKCTAKNIAERYHSVSGLRFDLQMVQNFLGEGDFLALKEWRIGSRDVSSFFMLPTVMVGRAKERAELIKVIDRVANSHSGFGSFNNANRASDASALSNDIVDAADASSEGASSVDGGNRRSGSFTQTISSDPRHSRIMAQSSLYNDTQTIASDTISFGHTSGPSSRRGWDKHYSFTFESRSHLDGMSERQASRQSVSDISSILSRQLGSKFRRRGQCEVVTIAGAGGLGKSFLVQQVLADVRRRGYCATAKFDTARRVAFGPLLKLISSLFKQVWGERNTETPLHLALKDYVRPIWSNLHKTLGLPEFLLGSPDARIARSVSSAQNTVDLRMKRSPIKRRGSSPGKSPPGSAPSRSPRVTSQSSQDFLRSNASTKTIRLMNTFLDILRIFSSYHFIALCLDDLHYADDESLDLITQLIAARLKILLILTYRPDELDLDKLERVISPAEPEDHPKAVGPRVTTINLSPLSEAEIIQYVATTLCRPAEDVASLALVIESKTAGNPFYMREMLNACHRKKCIWYDHRESRWLFDLDRLFEQFQGEHDYDILDNAFILRRLHELPLASRSILAWASLLGNSFSFALISQLLTGEFSDQAGCRLQSGAASSHYGFSKQDAVAGLQAAVNACIIVQSETDDRFRFVHDRYIQAASTLEESDTAKMHFVIAQTLMKHSDLFSPSSDSIASHICEASDIIKSRLTVRRPFRQRLMDSAAEAAENGARPTAIKYYSRALDLLQPNPWSTTEEDVSYDETLQLFLRTAECYVYMGNSTLASGLLQTIFNQAETAGDKAPAWLLLSRIQAQNGDSESARITLKQSLSHLAVPFDPEPTYEKCDEVFMKLATRIKSLEKPNVPIPLGTLDARRLIIGSILSDACSAAWWSDCLDFYNLSLTLINLHLDEGPFPQSGMAFLHISMIALARFNMIEYAAELGSICVEFLDKYRDPFSQARGYMIHSNFVSHINVPMGEAVSHLENIVEYAAAAGDRISTILAFGLSAQMRFFASENVIDLEAVCQYCCEEVPGWHLDTRGGTFLVTVRQLCRALQGKTNVSSAKEVMSDEHHSSSNYKKWLHTTTRNGGRSVLLYETMEIIPLFLYEHYEQACELGRRCLDRLGLIWSARNTRVVLLYYGLSLSGLMLRKINDPRNTGVDLSNDIKETIDQIDGFNKKIKDWQEVSDVNYLAWSKWLDAQVAELRGDHGFAIEKYETALDHASEHSFVFEEALGSYLMAGFFIRRSARRSAAAVLRESVGLWRQLGATGITARIEEEHVLLLKGPTRHFRTAEVAVQTEIAGDTAGVAYTPDSEELPATLQPTIAESNAARMAAWRGSMPPDTGVGLPALDMIDLHSILLSSQIISSVLQVDELLKTMCQVILENCGSSATQASIVIQDEGDGSGEWCIAASGDPERGATAHHPRLPLSGASHVAENVILYCTRFREPLFIPDLLSDERFGNVNNTWLQRNPLSKAVIAIPICHGSKPLLGVLYLEGQPGSFTDRNVTVLQLLVNQIGISYSNALAMKAVEKVSAENNSMIEVQRKMVVQAREAETKAKNAEAEAKRNVKIAEEAAKAKGIFLANVSHELRTPLNGVIGNSELLRDGNLNKEQMEMADSIRVSADLLLTVINDILDFSKMEADKMKLYIIAFNPEEMIREVVRAASYRNREKTSKTNVKIIQDINLPRMLIYGDPIRLHQVLGNLIGNSLKFTEDGSITIGARIDSETTEQVTLTFWVRDTGIGIPPQQLAKLFQPFSQADPSTARKYGGSGLGLSICKSLIETMMKGKIQLDSEANVGTTAWFTITFDKANPEASAGDVQQTVAAPPTVDRQDASPPARRMSVLNPFTNLISIPREQIRICIAEDNLINQRIAIQYVRKLGYTNVDAYENGLKAVEGLRRKAREGQPYQVVLMDVQMPVLDGYEATKLLRKDELEDVRKVLVIAMTASAIQGDREKCLAAGMNDYLAKPVKADLLKRKLDAYTVGAHERNLAQTQLSNGAELIQSTTTTIVTPAPSPPVIKEGEVDSSTSPPLVVPTTDPSGLIRSPELYSAPSLTSSDTRLSDRGSVTDFTSDASIMSGQTSRRQPRKLTKSRNSSEANVAIPERPKGVLRKNRRPTSVSNVHDLDRGHESGAPLGSNQSIRSSADNDRPSSLKSNSSSTGTKGGFFIK
ncbi:putative histidine kinase HHK1p [Microdochium trichocladiopsis]|uniref:histidine kinase n=1 Tax=Microdochium trichocladiopsis TaxID=1682393 RepID=A0A9P8YJF2_9PEZI|nr:putative histidine kinase HHK1p [Microdochium trichocladiopsis]KAH7040516.1 putative histidine kinase HHK1p [Microdochium trichocladiopsis]